MLMNSGPRIKREKKTVQAMIRLYCHRRHRGSRGLCASCRSLQAYAMERLEKCPFGESKSTCSKCLVHCYKPDMRERIQEIMRFAGPRILFRHPWLAIRHLMDERSQPPNLQVLRDKQRDQT